MAEVLVDSYSESNQDHLWILFSGSYNKLGQSFTAIAGNLSSCKFYLKKAGSPTGNAIAKLYAHSGTYGTSSLPTGEPLAISDNFDVSDLATSFQLITFTFSGANQYTLVDGTYYIIVIEYDSGSSGNEVSAGADKTSPTHSGNPSYYTTNWATFSTQDVCFYVYALEEEEEEEAENTMMMQQAFG